MFLGGAIAALAGCPGTLADPGAFPDVAPTDAGKLDASCNGVVTALFASTCAVATCHSSSVPADGVDLQSPNIYHRLLGQLAADGGGFILAPDGSVDGSVLYEVLTGSPDPPGGARMPLGTSIDQVTLQCVAEWIADRGKISDGGASDSATTTDGGIADAGGAPDGDAAAADAKAADTGSKDATVTDAKPSDAGVKDARGADARARDARGDDAKAGDAGTNDASAHG
jgi:hypothetical protein